VLARKNQEELSIDSKAGIFDLGASLADDGRLVTKD